MDTQLKRGMTEVCVLALLARGESYGYKLIKDLSGVMTLSESTLYPVLRRLESLGRLETRTEERNGRLRKYYAITDAGRRQIDEFVAEWADVKRAYAFIEEGQK